MIAAAVGRKGGSSTKSSISVQNCRVASYRVTGVQCLILHSTTRELSTAHRLAPSAYVSTAPCSSIAPTPVPDTA
eukprot:3941180-Rhodomonas_salina.1